VSGNDDPKRSHYDFLHVGHLTVAGVTANILTQGLAHSAWPMVEYAGVPVNRSVVEWLRELRPAVRMSPRPQVSAR
jgi:hypothetical protein